MSACDQDRFYHLNATVLGLKKVCVLLPSDQNIKEALYTTDKWQSLEKQLSHWSYSSPHGGLEKTPLAVPCSTPREFKYSQTLFIRASLNRMPHNPNTLLSISIYNDSVICMFHNPKTFSWALICSDKRGLTVHGIQTVRCVYNNCPVACYICLHGF